MAHGLVVFATPLGGHLLPLELGTSKRFHDDLSETKRGETNQEIKAYRRSLKIRSSPGLDEAQRPQRVAGDSNLEDGILSLLRS